MMLKDMRIMLSNINAKNNQEGTCDCIGVAFQKEQGSDTVKGYSFTCLGARGSTFQIKVPVNDENSKLFKESQEKLRKEEVIKITPQNVVITPYAFITKEGNLLSGVSVKADSIEILEAPTSKY